MKRSQPSFTKVTSPSASVIHMSAGVVSASSRKLRLAVADEVVVPGPLRRRSEHVRHGLEEVGVVLAEVGAAPG